MSNCKYCGAEIKWEDKNPHNVDGSRHICKNKPPPSKLCKYECGTLLEWDDMEKAFTEPETELKHTKERCQEAKAKLAQKDDHGNETYNPIKETQRFSNLIPTDVDKFVDHTQTAELKLKLFTDPTAEGLALQYNNFAKEHKIKFSQYQLAPSLYTIAVWYEELKHE